MNVEGRDRRERARHLMMAALDSELSTEERRELDGYLATDERLNSEWKQMARVKEVTETMGYRELPEEIWDGYWEGVYSRLERGLGWILVSLGGIVLIGYAAWQWIETVLAESGLPNYVKLALFVAVLGGIILLFSVAREKWFTRKSDPYKEIQR